MRPPMAVEKRGLGAEKLMKKGLKIGEYFIKKGEKKGQFYLKQIFRKYFQNSRNSHLHHTHNYIYKVFDTDSVRV